VQSVFGIARHDQRRGRQQSEAGTSKAKTYSSALRSRRSAAGLNVTIDNSDIRQYGYPGGIGLRIFCKASTSWERPRRLTTISASAIFSGLTGRRSFDAGLTGRLSAGGGNSLTCTRSTSSAILAREEESINLSVDYETQRTVLELSR